MKKDATGRVQAEIEQLEDSKRRVYLLSLVCGTLIFLLSWPFRNPDDVFIEVLYPLFALLFAGAFVVLWQKIVVLWKFEFLMYILVSLIIMSRLAWHFNFTSIDDRLIDLVGGHYWAVGILIILGFVMLDQKWGIIAGLLIIMLSLIIVCIGHVEDLQHELMADSLVYLVRVHLFLLMILGLTNAATIMRQRLHSALVRAEVLDEWASTDMLTGLANRRAAEKHLKRQASVAERYHRPFSVIFGDVDHFKQINDTYGHAAGDAVLSKIAGMLVDSVRESDFVARWGGEEFLVVAPETSLGEALRLAERCREVIAEKPMAGHRVTMSIGVAALRPDDSVESVLERADEMLYIAKTGGRNRVRSE